MLFAFRIIMSQAILRLHRAKANDVPRARHGPPALDAAAVRARARLALRRPRGLGHRAWLAAAERPEEHASPPR